MPSLCLSCADKPGILADVSAFIRDYGGNVEDGQRQLIDDQENLYLRIPWSQTSGEPVDADDFLQKFEGIRSQYGMTLQPDFQNGDTKKRVLVLCSKTPHCVTEILSRANEGNVAMQIPCVVSNHQDLRDEVQRFGVPFHYLPFESTISKRNPEHDRALVEFVNEQNWDIVVLARWMRFLPDEILTGIRKDDVSRIINIHHGPLPGVEGANVYRRLYERKTKKVTATAHFATEDLDKGPIIEESTARVPEPLKYVDYVKTGRENETSALIRAIELRLRNSVMITRDGMGTVCFE